MMSPPVPSAHVAYVTALPSGAHVGAVSTTFSARVRRRGVPPGRSITHTLPSAVNATRLPSGDSAGSRISRATTESAIVYEPRTSAPSDCSTSALNGISVFCPDAMSMRHNLPPNDVMIALSFGSHADVGNGPMPVGGGGGGGGA